MLFWLMTIKVILLSLQLAHPAADMQQARSQQQSCLDDEELQKFGSFPEDTEHEALPTSTHMSLQADTQDPECVSNSPSAAASLTPSSAAPLPGSNSIGQLSFMSDGSFVHVGDTSQADAEVSDQEGALDQGEDLPLVMTESATTEDVSQHADTLLDQLSEGLLEIPEAAEADAAVMPAEASVETDEACLAFSQCVTVRRHAVYALVLCWHLSSAHRVYFCKLQDF